MAQELPLAALDYNPRLRKLREHVEHHFDEDIPLAKAAEITGLEKKYFSTFFHQKTGMCFSHWITQERVRRAAELIERTDRPITWVALEVGFHELRTFERAFKKWQGMTPRSFKRAVQPR